jgi:hypothetical protein
MDEVEKYNFVDILYKSLVIIAPVIILIGLYYLWLLFFYIRVRIVIIRNDLDLELIKTNYSIFKNSYKVYNSIKNINQEELDSLLEDINIRINNPYNFMVIGSTPINNDFAMANDAISNGSTESECIICFEILTSEIATQLECGHKFHIGCVNKWIKESNSCPLCKEIIL